MKKIINNSDNNLLFPSIDFFIKSKEIKNVNDTTYNVVINNYFISDYIKEIKKVENNKLKKIKKYEY